MSLIILSERICFQKLVTGHIEIEADELSVLNNARAQLPFLIRDQNTVCKIL